MDAPEKVTKQKKPESDIPLSVAERKERAWGIEQRDKKFNKIGIKYHPVKDTSTPPDNGRVTVLDHWLINQVVDMIGHPPLKIILWDGQAVYGGDKQDVPVVTLLDRGTLLRLIVDPEMQFGDLYSSGRIRFDGDMAGFLTIVFRSMGDYGAGGKLRRFITGLLHRTIGNTMARAKNNIYHHYDLSNEFYEKWLDTEAMQYTCAYFPDPQISLEQAQIAKLHHVCRKLQLKPGDTVVEAGCGWGGLARFMAQHYGVSVRAYNISREQIAFARNKAKEMGLADKVEYIEDDYRNIKGKYDVFVSVGMLEHVGTRNFKTLGDVINRCLRPDGRGLIHSIGRNQPGQMSSWTERRIFPGAYAPALSEMMDIFEHHDFSVWDVENLRLHYATTIEHWLERYEQHTDSVVDMFDESFVRAWRLYLCGSIASFASGTLGLFQILFARGDNNDVPWSRAYMYSPESNNPGRREPQE
ncbi:MAG: cyclopropane-fatty-acyl-phospholipid synthase family protein [Proteobacteria bacterium]|nr:cyclopropane-fatty-acyl-phospholipid synthase family protein [Pseudomonadota bacterium]